MATWWVRKMFMPDLELKLLAASGKRVGAEPATVQAAKHFTHSTLKRRKTFSPIQTCPFAFSVCW